MFARLEGFSVLVSKFGFYGFYLLGELVRQVFSAISSGGDV